MHQKGAVVGADLESMMTAQQARALIETESILVVAKEAGVAGMDSEER